MSTLNKPDVDIEVSFETSLVIAIIQFLSAQIEKKWEVYKIFIEISPSERDYNNYNYWANQTYAWWIWWSSTFPNVDIG